MEKGVFSSDSVGDIDVKPATFNIDHIPGVAGLVTGSADIATWDTQLFEYGAQSKGEPHTHRLFINQRAIRRMHRE